jgi:hypothetical protein
MMLPRHPGEGRGPALNKRLDTGLRRYDGLRAPALVLLVAACATTRPLTEAELQVYPDARGMPADVQDFVVRYQDCVHWQGEPGWDAERRRQIEHAVADVCPGLDAEAQRLRAHYAGNAAVIERLRGFEPVGQ